MSGKCEICKYRQEDGCKILKDDYLYYYAIFEPCKVKRVMSCIFWEYVGEDKKGETNG